MLELFEKIDKINNWNLVIKDINSKAIVLLTNSNI